MRKELIISTIPQETRLAILEDDELVELLIERRRAHGIAGNIYKGRVTKVLPGMQSAFVDIGLDRDAFLYVSDFFEENDSEEFERIVATAEEEAQGGSAQPKDRAAVGRRPVPPPVAAVEPALESVEESGAEPDLAPDDALDRSPAPPPASSSRERRGGGDRFERPDRGRRRNERGERRGRIPSFESRTRDDDGAPPPRLEVLPGESLARYRESGGDTPAVESFEDEPGLELDLGLEGDEPAVAAGLDEATETEDLLGLGLDPESEPAVPAARIGAAPEADDVAEAGEPEASTPVDEEPAETGEDAAEDETSRKARIEDRRDSMRFTRKAPARRPRRRSNKPDAKDARKDEARPSEPTISDLLREGQEILVQVSKEPLGKKGARITSHIALPGRYLVYMPTVDHIGVSRKIGSEEERSRLRRIIAENRDGLPGGFIVRTAAEGRDEAEFIQDLRFLGDLWRGIREKSEKTAAPALLHSDLNLVERILRDQLSDEFKAIRLDTEVEYRQVLDFVSRFQPALVHRVRLHLKDNAIFEEYGLQQEIDKALRAKVWLKSGGYIVINQTEALVAIDVNTGKFVGKSNRLEDTIVRTNMDAVHEIVRQIRLRNLGGIIVVDFIDMEERKNRQRVMQALEEELKKDRSPSKILQFNDFGLVAITRKRTQPSLERVLGSPCPRCAGSGYVKAVETVCYEILQEVKKMLHHVEGKELTVRVSPEVAKAIKSGEFVDFTELEDATRIDIRIQSDPLLPGERFDIS